MTAKNFLYYTNYKTAITQLAPFWPGINATYNFKFVQFA